MKIKSRGLAEWQNIFNQFSKSGDSVYDFCKKNNIKESTFRRKKYMLPQVKTESAKFVELKLPSLISVKIHLPNSLQIEIVTQNVSSLIKELMHAI